MIDQPDAEVAGAVDQRRLLELARHRQIELAQKEDAEGVEDRGNDQSGVAVEHAQRAREDEERHDDDRLRDQEGREHRKKDRVASGKAQPRQRIAGHGVEEQRDDRHRGGNEERVEEIADEIDLGEHVDEIVQRRTPRDEIRVEHLVRRLQRHRQHPEQRRDRHEREDDASEIERQPDGLQHRPLRRVLRQRSRGARPHS